MNIAIDGPAGAGKVQLQREFLSWDMSMRYGAMYRTMALYFLEIR